jgi:hypothetical protein
MPFNRGTRTEYGQAALFSAGKVNEMIEKTALKIMMLGLFASLAAFTCPAAAAMENSDCLECHGDAALVGAPLVIDALSFDHTAHAELGCHSCHSSITDGHPDDGLTPSRASCAECHEQVSKEYAASLHAGNASCSDCHNPHRAFGPTAVSGHDMNSQCMTCHGRADMLEKHGAWLPQADLHISMLPCITCHSSSAEYVVSLYIIKRHGSMLSGKFELASYEELSALSNGRPIEELVDRNADGYVSLAELRMFNLDPDNKQLRLQGMITPEGVSHNFRTQDDRWDCSFCHASGPAARQVSFLALAEPDGSFKRVAVEQGAVLDALYGTPDFYMVGSTRSSALNYVGLVILAGGLVMPIGHGTLRILTRKNRRHEEK